MLFPQAWRRRSNPQCPWAVLTPAIAATRSTRKRPAARSFENKLLDLLQSLMAFSGSWTRLKLRIFVYHVPSSAFLHGPDSSSAFVRLKSCALIHHTPDSSSALLGSGPFGRLVLRNWVGWLYAWLSSMIGRNRFWGLPKADPLPPYGQLGSAWLCGKLGKLPNSSRMGSGQSSGRIKEWGGLQAK